MPPPEVHLVTIEFDQQQQKWRANPPRVPAKKGDAIHWKPVGTNITVFIPDWSIFRFECFSLEDGEELGFKVRRAKGNNTAIDENPYAIFCDAGNCFAEGDSSPIIIIER